VQFFSNSSSCEKMAAAKQPLPVNPQTSDANYRLMTRAEASDLLGCSQATLINYERRGRLTVRWHAAIDQGGKLRGQMAMYLIDDVVKLPRKHPNPTPENPDELCARAFEMFELGKSEREIVVLLRATYDKIHALHEQWRDAGGVAIELSESQRAAIVRLVGEFSSGEQLVEIVRQSIEGDTL
jgi:hypothetical protein